MAVDEGLFLVCGLGHVGTRIVRLLRRLGHEVSVLTTEADAHATDLLGAALHTGDARDKACLERAGLSRARAVIAATASDLVNLEVALEVRRSRPEIPVVARLFDQTLAHELEAQLGLRRAPAKSALAAPGFAAAGLGLSVRGSFTWEGKGYVCARFAKGTEAPRGAVVVPGSESDPVHVLSEDTWRGTWGIDKRVAARRRKLMSPLEAARTIRLLWRNAPRLLRSALVAVLGLTAVSVAVFSWGLGLSPIDSFYFVVTTLTTTGYGDITPKDGAAWLKLYGCLLMLLGSMTMAALYSLLTDFVVAERVATAAQAKAPPSEDHVIVVGVGNLGLRVASELARGGVPVACISRDTTADHSQDLDVSVVEGDARAVPVLARANARTASAILALTDDDAANLGIALSARHLNPSIRAVVRVYDESLCEKVESGLGLTALSASAIAAPTFVAAACADGVLEAYVDASELVVVREVAWSHAERGVVIARDGRLTKHGDDEVRDGEKVVVLERWALT